MTRSLSRGGIVPEEISGRGLSVVGHAPGGSSRGDPFIKSAAPALRTQHTFDRQLRVPPHRPTVGTDGAKHLLDFGEDLILAHCLDRTLSHSWDIGLGAHARELRILRASIDHYIQYGSAPFPLSDAQVLALILPPGHKRAWLTNGEVQRALNCGSTHILNLVDAKALRLQPHTTFSRGPNGSALITTDSFTRFLESRRLP